MYLSTTTSSLFILCWTLISITYQGTGQDDLIGTIESLDEREPLGVSLKKRAFGLDKF